MQKLFARPVATPFFLIFGIVLSQFGYGYLQRGSFQYTPQHGVPQIISPRTNPGLYWAVSAGMVTVGAICLLLSAYSVVCLVRAYRVEGARLFPPRAFGIVMFALGLLGLVIASLLYTCSHP
jgi:hypothetical protein